MSTRENHGNPWTPDNSAELRTLFEEGLALDVIAERLGRTQSAICSQLERLKLIANFGGVYHRMDPTPWADLRKRR